jgi:hypothetical protein
VLDGAVPVGGPCSNSSLCKRGTLNGTLLGGFVSCLPFGGSSDNRCRAYAPTSTVGATCVDYQSDPTRGGALSDTTVNICAPGLECLNSACATGPAVGAACPNGVCADSYCGPGALCAAFGQNGDSCTAGTCVQGSSCNAGTCQSDPPVPWILDVGFTSTTYMCPG